MGEDKLKELFDWAFGRNGSLHQAIYLDAVAEVERLARLGAAVETKVLETQEPRSGEKLSEMHPAQRNKYYPSEEMNLESASVLLNGIFALVLVNE